MALATLGELKTSVTTRAARTGETAFATALPEYVQLAEQRMMYGGAKPFETTALRLQQMETTADITITNGSGTLPSTYLAIRRAFWVANPNIELIYVTPDEFWTLANTQQAAAAPVHFTIEGMTIYLSPNVGGTVKLSYYAPITALSADGDSNWLLLNAPSVYLHATLLEAYLALRNDKEAAVAFANYKAACDALTMTESRARFSGRLVPRVAST